MVYNNLFGIYCFTCNKYLNPHTEVYLNVLYEGSITCKEDHLVGNITDPQWKELFGEKCPYYYEYHKQGNCRCTQEETKCLNNIENCENLLAKESYEADLKEEK
jgi:hypothetical protein